MRLDDGRAPGRPVDPARRRDAVCRAGAALVVACAAALGVARPARAIVTGTPPTLYHQFTVQGSAQAIGNTLMAYQMDPRVNSLLLQPAWTGSTLKNIPINAKIEGAYVFYSGRTDVSTDTTFDFYTPDGRILHLTADFCRTLNYLGNSFFYCRKDVTSYVRSVEPLQGGDPNGVYNVNGVDAKVGVTGSLSDGCSVTDPGCQAAYAGWSMVVVWSSPSYNHVRNLNLYDGFLACDEDAVSSGISPPIPLTGFTVGSPAAVEITDFGLEGDPQLGDPPLDATWADFMRFIAQDGTAEKLQSIPSNPPNNLFNSTVPDAAVPFDGVDIDTFELGPTGLNLVKPGQTSASIQPGSGDGIVDGSGNGEFFALGYVLLAVDTIAPQFGGTTGKTVDKTTAAVGETLTYTVKVENTGTEAATNVVVKDLLPPSTTYVAGSTSLDGTALSDVNGQTPLAGGLNLGTVDYRAGTTTSHTITLQVRIDTSAADGSQICNTATVDSDQTSAKPLTTSPCTTVSAPALQAPPTLSVEDLDGTPTIPGHHLRYDLRLTNTGSQPARNVSVYADLPKYVNGLSVVTVPSGSTDASSPTGGANGSGYVKVTGITVPGNFSVDVIYQVTIDSTSQLLAAGVQSYAIDGLKLSTQAKVTAPYLSNPYLSDDPATSASPDPTVVTLDYGVDLSTSTKTGVDANGAPLTPGDTIDYAITVKNTRNRDAHVVVTDDLPGQVQSCALLQAPAGTTCSQSGGAFGSGQLVTPKFLVPAGGGTVTIRFTVTVRQSAADGSMVINSALLAADELKNPVRVTSSGLTVFNRPVLSKSTKSVVDLNGGNVVPGDVLRYTIVVRNDGTQPATNVTVTDPLPAHLVSVTPSNGGTVSSGTLTWTSTTTSALASVAPGSQVSLTFDATVEKPTANGTVISNQATIACDQIPNGVPTDDPSTPAVDDPTKVTVTSAPVFTSTTKTATDVNGGVLRPGDTLHYTITVKNTGNALATGVTVTDAIDPNLTQVAPGNGGSFSGGSITWNLGTVGLSPGGDVTLGFDAVVASPLPNGTVISNQAFVHANELSSPTPSDDPATPTVGDPTRVTVTSTASMTSTKTYTDLNGGAQMPGDVLEYQITLKATGDAPVRSATVTDPIPSCLTSIVPQNGGVFAGGKITWNATTTPALADVVPGTNPVLVFRATISPGTPNGTDCPNQGQVSSADLPGTVLTDDPSTPAPLDPTVVHVVSRPVLDTTTKTVSLVKDRNGDGTYSPGDRIGYVITVKNTGTEPATSVVVTDPISSKLTNLAPADGGTVSGSTVTWAVGTLAVGASVSLHLQADVVAPLDNGTTVANQGTVTYTGAPSPVLTDDPTTPAPHDPTIITLKSAPDLSTTTKSVSDPNGAPVRPGDTLVYTIVVRNTGTAVAHGATVTDAIDPNLVFVSATAGGVYDAATRTLSWTLGDVGLSPGGDRTLVLDAKVVTPLDNGTVISNQAFVKASNLAQPAPSDDPRTATKGDPTKVTVVSGANLTTSTKTVVDGNGGQVRPGDPLTWTITVRNTGDAIARQVTVDDPVSPDLTAVVPGQGGTFASGKVHWDATTTPALLAVSPGNAVQLTFTSKVVIPLDNGTVISNQGFISATGLATPTPTDDPSTPSPGDPTKVTVHASTDLTGSTKTVTDVNGGQVRPGDALTWTLTLANKGDMVARQVTVTDVLDPNLVFVGAGSGGAYDAATRTVTWQVPAVGLAPNGNVALTLDTKVAFPLDDGTVIANQGAITGPSITGTVRTDDPATPAPSDPTKVTVHAAPDLSTATKTVVDENGGQVTPGDVLGYTITVPNTGDMIARGVTVTDVVDPNLVNVQVADGGSFSAGTRTITWPAADLAPGAGAARVVHFTATVKPLTAGGTRIPNQAVAHWKSKSWDTDDPTTPAAHDPTTVTVVAAPILDDSTKTVKDVNGGLVAPGDTLAYTIVVHNSGNTYANHVRVVDPIDPSLTGVVPADGGVVTGNQIVWDETTTPALLRVSPVTGGDVTLHFTARIRAVVPDGTKIVNQGRISAAELAQPAVTDDPTTPAHGDPTVITVSIPDLSTSTKTVTDVNGGKVHPGDVLRWTIDVKNTGSHDADGVQVTDPVDPNLTAIQVAGGGVLSSGTITWQVGTVPAGGDAKLTFTAKVKPLLANGTVISNQARITTPMLPQAVLTDDPSTPAPHDPTKVTVHSAPDFKEATKRVTDLNGGDVVPGDKLRYDITYTNDGDTYATNCVIRDSLDPSLTGITTQPAAHRVGREATWTSTEIPALAKLAPGDTVKIEIDGTVVTPLQNGTVIVNQAFLFDAEQPTRPWYTDDPTTPAPHDPTKVTVLSAPRLSHSLKTVTDVNGGDLEPGDVLAYTIDVVNDGTEDATGVRLTDAVPGSTHYVPGSTTLNGKKVADVPGGRFPLAMGLLVRSPRPGTADGTILADDGKPPEDEIAVVTFRVRVDDGTPGGTVISNQGVLASDQVAPVGTDDPSTPMPNDPTVIVVGKRVVLSPAWKTWKLVVDHNTPGVVEPGDVVEYDIVIPNRGTVPATNVVFDDGIPTGTTYVAGSLMLDGTSLTDAPDGDAGQASASGVRVTVPRIDAGGQSTIAFRVKVADGAPPTVVNQGTVTGASPGGVLITTKTDADPATPGDQPTVFPVGAIPVHDLSTSVKSAQDVNGGRLREGDLVRYTVVVRNTGNVPATGVVVEDDVPARTTFVQSEAPSGVRTDVADPPAGAHQRGQVRFTLQGGLAPGASMRIPFLVRLDGQIPDGATIENVAQVKSDHVKPFDLPPVREIVGGLPGDGGYAGKVFEDLGKRDGRFEAGTDVALPGFTVLAYAAGDPKTEVDRAVTDDRGDFTLLGLTPGQDYLLRFVSPTGAQMGSETAPAVTANSVEVEDGPIDPSGVVYRARSGDGIPGAHVYLLYDDSMVGKAPLPCDADQSPVDLVEDPTIGASATNPLPRPVGAGCLAMGQQGQETPAGSAAGFYRFDVPPSDPPTAYRVVVVPPAPQLAFPSVTIPPTPGFAPQGPVVPSARPNPKGDTTYYLRFKIGTAKDAITNDHIPLDPVSSLVTVTKVAGKATASVGDLVPYTVTVTNRSGEDLKVIPGGVSGGVTVQDVVPDGFRFVEGTTVATRLVPTPDGTDQRTCPRLSQITGACPSERDGPERDAPGKHGPVPGQILSFGPYDLPAGQRLEVRYTLVVAADAQQGLHVNHATALLDGVPLGEAEAPVRVVPDPLFDEGTVYGKVFCDANGDGIQDVGDYGLPGVRIYVDDGHYAETDGGGKYHLHRLLPGLRIFKIDPGTLPPGVQIIGPPAKTYDLTAGLDTVLDFPVRCSLPQVAPKTVRVMAPKAPPTVKVGGRVDSLAATVADQPLEILHPDLTVAGAAKDGDADLPAAKVTFHTKVSAPVLDWQLAVVRVPAHPGPGDPEGWPAVKVLGGTGRPPETLTWTPAAKIKGVFAAWLFVEGPSARAARSPVRLLGVGRHPRPVPPFLRTFPAASFSPYGTWPTRLLRRGLLPLLAYLKAHPTATARIEVHVDDGYGGRAGPLTERRAARVKKWLVRRGADGTRIDAVGRGSSVPLVPNIGRRNRHENRRVDVVARVPDPTPPLPALSFAPKVALTGAKGLAVSGTGRFGTTLAMPPDGELVLGLRRGDGATFGAAVALDASGKPADLVSAVDAEGHAREVHLEDLPSYRKAAARAAGGFVTAPAVTLSAANTDPPGPTASSAAVPITVTVPAAGAPSIAVAGGQVPSPLLDVGATLRGQSTIRLGRRNRPTTPLVFATRVDASIRAARWRLVIEDPRGRAVARTGHGGKVPARIRWRAVDRHGRGLLRRGRGYRYHLEVTARDGDTGRSPAGAFAVASAARVQVLRGLFVGTRIPPMRRLKLAALAAAARRAARVEVVVHTDNAGGQAAARARSMKQAAQVASVLEADGVARSRVHAVGVGDSRPLVPNFTPRGRAKNRRVAVRLVPWPTRVPGQVTVTPSVTVAGRKAVRHGDRFVASAAPGTTVKVAVIGPHGRRATVSVKVPGAKAAVAAAAPAPGAMIGGGTRLGSPAPAPPAAPKGAAPGKGQAALAASGTPPKSPPGAEAGTRLGAPAPAPSLQRVPPKAPGKVLVTRTLAEVDPTKVPAARTRVRLPPNDAVVRGDHLAILGVTAPKNTVRIDGKKIELGDGGRFVTVVPLTRGKSTVKVLVTDPAGDQVTFERHVVSDPDRFVLMAAADTAMGRTGSELPGVGPENELALGPLYLYGRAVVYGKGQWHGDFGPWKDLKLTLHLDTSKTRNETYFQDLVQPGAHYAIYGDSGAEVQDVSADGPIYLSLSADENRLLVGNFKTTLGTGGLFDYERTFYGAKLHVDQTLGKAFLTRADAFVSDGDVGLRYGHVVLQGTGGSLYFLKDKDVVEGSERLRIEVRDRETGALVSTRYLQRNVDYVIRYPEGQVILDQPLSSVAGAGWLGAPDIVSTLAGDPVFLVADYSYVATPDARHLAGGGYAQETWNHLITVGGGALAQGNGTGADPYSLVGVSAALTATPRSFLKVEYAHSSGTDAEGYYSADGGLTYSALLPTCVGAAQFQPQCRTGGNAVKLDGSLSLGDLLGKKKDILRLTVDGEFDTRGFYTSARLLDQGQKRLGGTLTWDASKHDQVQGRLDETESLIPSGPEASGTTDLLPVDRTFVSLGWRHTAKRWRAQATWNGVIVHGPVGNTNATLSTHVLGLGGEYDLTKRLTLLLQQDLVLGGDPRYFKAFGDRMTTTAGGRYKLTDAVALTLAAQARWDGANSGILGLRLKTGKSSHVYADERMTLLGGGGSELTSVLGADQNLGAGTHAYGEYQVDGAMSGTSGRAVFGIANHFQPWKGIRLGLGLERVQVLGPTTAVATTGTGIPGTIVNPTTGQVSTTGLVDGIPPFEAAGANPAGAFYPGATSRTAGNASIELLRKAVKGSLRLEARYDAADPSLVGKVPGVATRLQGVVLGNVAWKFTPDLSLLAHLNWSATRNVDRNLYEALWMESTAGAAFRPVGYDWVNVLFKYTYLIDQRPLDLTKGTADRQTSQILALAPTFETPWHLGLSEKLAYKLTRIDGGIGEPAAVRPAEAYAHTILWVNRLDLHLTEHIDLSGEYRMLWVLTGAKGTTGLASSLRSGFLVEAAWRMSDHLRLGAGWNFTSFGDNELSRFDRNQSGPFLRVTGLY